MNEKLFEQLGIHGWSLEDEKFGNGVALDG